MTRFAGRSSAAAVSHAQLLRSARVGESTRGHSGAAPSASMPLRSFGYLRFAIHRGGAPMGLAKAPLPDRGRAADGNSHVRVEAEAEPLQERADALFGRAVLA